MRDIKPIIGYVHTGIEKNCEDKAYWKVIPLVERMDYLSYYFNALAYCGAVETLLDIEVPKRAQYLRVIHLELNRIASHLLWLATGGLDLGAMSVFWYGWRERDLILDCFEMSSGQRMHPRYFQVGGVAEDIPTGFEAKVRAFTAAVPEARRPAREPDQLRTRSCSSACAASAPSTRTRCSPTASPARCCAPPATRGTCARPSRTAPTRTSTSRSRSARSATTTTAIASAWPRCASRRGSSTRRSTGCPRATTSPPTASTRCRRGTSWRRRWRR